MEKNSQLGLGFHCLQNIVAEMALNHGERAIPTPPPILLSLNEHYSYLREEFPVDER